MQIFDFVTSFETACLITAAVSLRKDPYPFWKISLTYISFVCLVELVIGKYFTIKYHNNMWVYNLFVLFEAAYITYGMHHALKKYKNTNLIIIIGTLLIYLSFGWYTFKNGIYSYNSLTISIMSVVFVIYGLYYYYMVLTDPELIETEGNPVFWWVNATIFYYFGSTTTNLFSDLFMKVKFGDFSLRYIVFIALNFLLYGLWAYAFICRAKQRKLPS